MSETEKDRPIFCFTKGNEPCNRALVVEGIVYRVHSETLIQHSEYFRTMFTTDFFEKNQEEIELNEVSAKEMKLFLTVLFKPETVEVTEEVLSILFGVFPYFQATKYFSEFLKEKKVFDIILPWKLLTLEKQYGIPELKSAIERMLLDKFNKKFPKPGKEFYKITRKYVECDYFLDVCHHLVDEFGLIKLQARIEFIADYHLAEFVKHESLRALINRGGILILFAKALRSDRLRATVETSYINEYNKPKHQSTARKIIRKVAERFDLQNLKVAIMERKLSKMNYKKSKRLNNEDETARRLESSSEESSSDSSSSEGSSSDSSSSDSSSAEERSSDVSIDTEEEDNNNE